MGQASDDAFNAALHELEMHDAVNAGLRAQGCECEADIVINDDGMFECQSCKRTTDY